MTDVLDPVITGGAAVVRSLEDHGVEFVFGIPGTHNLEIYRYLAGSSIRHVTPRHEQGAGYAADGYARATGRPGVVLTTSGPGLTNATTAAATSYADSIPILLISPGVPQGMERADVGWLHELKDQSAHLAAILERSIRVTDADEIGPAVAEIFFRWQVGRPRPVHLEIPVDVLEGSWCAPQRSPSMPGPVRARPPDSRPAAEAVTLLAGAERPAILVGGGARRARDSVRALAELVQAPVITTVNGKGVLDEGHPLSLGAAIRLPHAQQLLSQSDVLLIVGSELGDSDLWGGKLEPVGRVIRVDIDPAQAQKNVSADVVLIADADAALPEIVRQLSSAEPGRSGSRTQSALARVNQARSVIEEQALESGAPWRQVQDVLRAVMPPDVIVAGDSAQVSYFGTVSFWPMSDPGRFLYPTGYATLGYGLPAAIGAQLGQPDRTVLVLVGDGGFQFTAMELLTAVDEDLRLVVVVMNNYGFQEIREGQLARGIAPIGVDVKGPDFAALARACGASGVTLAGLDGLDGLGSAVEQALATDGPTLIDVQLPARSHQERYESTTPARSDSM